MSVTVPGKSWWRDGAGSRLRHEDGFTLIELLVSMVAGLVVLGALGTVIAVTLRQTTDTFTRVDATERARTMVAHIEQELHSACLVTGVTPIEGGADGTQVSDANHLVFLSAYGTSAQPTPTEHEITFDPTRGTLTEYTYALTSGTGQQNWLFSSTPSLPAGRLLLTNVAQMRTQNGTAVPVFQYFAYEPYTDVNGNQAMMLMDGTSSVPGTSALPNPDPLPTSSGLSQTNAAATSEVMINLDVGAAGGNMENTNLTDTVDPVTDALVLRFTPPPDTVSAGTIPGPCA
jgi:prepilin-type N-terminal cleavage/methylation domain-containing protein